MNNLPLITVITPSFNQGKFIRQTIESVLSQDYPKIEYLIMDGGSTDEVQSILREYDGRLQWISEPDRGQTHAINKGFRKARGEIICWLNSDDIFLPGAVSIIANAFLKHPDVMMVYGEGNLMTEDGWILGRFPYTRPFDLWQIMRGVDYILQPACFFRKEAYEAVGGLDENLNWCMDWDMWIKIGSRFKVLYVADCLANARLHSKSKTSHGSITRLREVLGLLKKNNRKPYRWQTCGVLVGYLKSISYDKILNCFHVSPLPGMRFRKLIRDVLFNDQGVYADRSLGKKALFMFPLGMPVDKITIELGRLDGNQGKSLEIDVAVNDIRVGNHTMLFPNPFMVTIPYDKALQKPTEITLLFDHAFAHGSFWRRRSCLLLGVSMT